MWGFTKTSQFGRRFFRFSRGESGKMGPCQTGAHPPRRRRLSPMFPPPRPGSGRRIFDLLDVAATAVNEPTSLLLRRSPKGTAPETILFRLRPAGAGLSNEGEKVSFEILGFQTRISITGGFFSGSGLGRFPKKRTGPSAARRVFFRKRGFRKNDFSFFAPEAQTPRRSAFFAPVGANSPWQGFAARKRRNKLKLFLPETAFSAKILLAERSVRAKRVHVAQRNPQIV